MAIRDELLALKNDQGLIIVEQAVDWARDNPGSSLHGALEWDDSKAAHEHRLWQIRRLVAINCTYENGERQIVSLSIDRSRDGGGYRDLDEVLPIKSLREILLDDALKELERIRLKYQRLTELAEVWAAKEVVVRRRGRKGGKDDRGAATA